VDGVTSGRVIGRREFLRRSAAAGAGVTLAAALAACDRAGMESSERAGVSLAVPTREHPATWPFSGANPPIESGLPIERGATLRVYQWREYLYDDVLEEFLHRYRGEDVGIEVQSFSTMDEAIARLQRPGSDFDVFFPTIDALPRLIAAGMLRPLNHDYLANVANLWPWFLGTDSPFYDRGQRYTVPYTVYSSGVGWRTDMVRSEEAPDVSGVGFDALWNPRYREDVGIYDDYREALGLSLLRNGVTRPDAADGAALWAAGDGLVDLVNEAGARITAEGAYEALPRGRFAMHQAWSGDVISGILHGVGDRGRTASPIGYWWPMDGGVVGADLTAVLTQGRNPVLAHTFVNHLLDVDVAILNFGWNGYQPPLADATAAAFAAHGPALRRVVGDLHSCTILTPEEFDRGVMLLEHEPAVESLWIDQWERVTART